MKRALIIAAMVAALLPSLAGAEEPAALQALEVRAARAYLVTNIQISNLERRVAELETLVSALTNVVADVLVTLEATRRASGASRPDKR